VDLSLFLAQSSEQGGFRELIDRLARTPLSQVVTFVVILTLIRMAIFPIMQRTPAHKRLGGYKFLGFLNEVIDAFVYAGVFVFLLIRPFLLQAFLIPSGSMWPTLYINDFIVANKAIYRYTDPKQGDIVVFRPPATAQTSPNQIDENGDMKVDFIKRCIGTPGDLIELRKGILYRNGQKVDEPYVHYSDTGRDDQTLTEKSEADKAAMLLANFKLVKWHDTDGKERIIPLNYTEYDANSPMPSGGRSFAETPYNTAQEFIIQDPYEQRQAKALPAQPVPKGYYLMMGDNRNGSFDSRGWGLVPRESIIGRSEFIWLPITRWRMTR
jgi:signal peptidase I